uniref:Uncharacterized protein n=1 Tax=Moniliophthora roreri TaxID=221103 RepID=A0A0W0FER5_MONRR
MSFLVALERADQVKGLEAIPRSAVCRRKARRDVQPTEVEVTAYHYLSEEAELNSILPTENVSCVAEYHRPETTHFCCLASQSGGERI